MRGGRLVALSLSLACDRSAEPAPPASPPAASPAGPQDSSATPPATPPAAPPATVDRQRPPPGGFLDLREAVPGIRLDIRYHGVDNFTGAPLPGYGAPGAWLREEAAWALARVQSDLGAEELGLLVYDAYRPRRATLGMVAWAQRSDRVDVLDDGYVARRSGHNRGNTVDLTLVDAGTGVALEMGTAWDTFSTASHPENATGQARENRRRLAEAMMAQGWQPYAKEWWHFSFPLEPAPAERDVPYGCFEPDEGSWAPPTGWDAPGWVAPTQWPSPAQAPCG